jgi:hypothetical protein
LRDLALLVVLVVVVALNGVIDWSRNKFDNVELSPPTFFSWSDRVNP